MPRTAFGKNDAFDRRLVKVEMQSTKEQSLSNVSFRGSPGGHWLQSLVRSLSTNVPTVRNKVAPMRAWFVYLPGDHYDIVTIEITQILPYFQWTLVWMIDLVCGRLK
jgi:hypothetical protein